MPVVALTDGCAFCKVQILLDLSEIAVVVTAMSDFWISQKRHHCQICNCWLSGHAQNIANHEKSDRHVNNVRRQLKDMHVRERKRKQEESELNAEIARIEAAARISFLQNDVQPNESSVIVPFDRVSVSLQSKKGRFDQGPPMVVPPPIDSFSPFSLNIPSCSAEHNSGPWVMSVDTKTQKPIYYNTVTGATTMEDPVGDTSVCGGVLAAGQTAWKPKEPDPLQKLVPVVHDMAEIYKSFVLGKTGELVSASDDKSSDQTTHGDIIEPQISDLKVSSVKFVPSARHVGYRPGFIFKMGPQGLGYYEDIPLTSAIVNEKIKNPLNTTETSNTPRASEPPNAEDKKDYDITQPRIGEWQEVEPSESKFGDCTSHLCEESNEEKTSSQLHSLSEKSKRLFKGVFAEESENVAAKLASLKEEAEASRALNDDDLERAAKMTFYSEKGERINSEIASEIKKEDNENEEAQPIFKRRVLKTKPTRTKRMI